MSTFLNALNERVLIFDGAFGTWVQDQPLSDADFGGPELEGCNENLVFTRPDLITTMHDEFLRAGVDAIETATFGAFPIVLAEYNIPEVTRELNRQAAQLAKVVARDHSTADRPRWVIGSVGPGTKLPSLGHIEFAELRDAYIPQMEGLLEGGVDVVLIETVQDLLQGKAAIVAARRAMATTGVSVPIMVQVTIETTGRMLIGSEIGAALTTLEAMRPDVIGLNCATGPAEMTEHLRYLGQHARTYLSCLPNAGLPSIVNGHTHYDLTPEQLAEAHERNVSEFGINIVGGCCGTTPAHLQAVVERLGAGRIASPRSPEFEPGAASVYTSVPFRQDNSVLLIGERTNANGSRKFRDAMLESDWDMCVQMAKEQVRESAHVLDVCVDYVGRDGVIDMNEIVSRFATQVPLPLVLDSTEPEVMEAGLAHCGGKAILNSANLEDGENPGSRLDRVFTLAREYGAAVICLAIDEEGQARTADWKLRVCKRIYDLAVNKYGIEPTDLIFDTLTFPLSSGQEDLRGDAVETIEAIRRIKAELPGAATVLGLSNVSFGLKPALRHVLNSVFLHECTEAGLDAAIVHAARIIPMHKIDENIRTMALDLIYDRRRDNYDPLHQLLDAFSNIDLSAIEKEDRSEWPVAERLKHRIIDGERDGIEADLDEQLDSLPGLAIINDVLLGGMKVVGELFATGEMQLPFVLQSAETMKLAVAYLEPHLEKSDAGGKGRFVIGTVKGDVHDIGKNLVDIILTNNGYEVHNIGIKAPLQTFVDKAKEVNADAVGMSGLLVKSTIIMRENLQAMNELGLDGFPVILGGAALTRNYVERDLREIYNGRVFYGKDAFEGLRTMDELMEGKRNGTLDPDFGRALGGRDLPARIKTNEPDDLIADTSRSDVAHDMPIFTPPFLGTRVAKGIAIDDIATYINETALFRNQWQFRPDKTISETDGDFKERLRPQLREEIAKAQAEDLLTPSVAWGYFPVNSEGNNLIVWTDDDRTTERVRFNFPRQRTEKRLCISDFFRTSEPDYAAFHVVTIGSRATEAERELFAADRYTEYLLLHGLSVEMTEALAEYWHRRIREEWGFAAEDGPTLQGLFRQKYRGSRYSWGYPACPDLEEQTKLDELLDLSSIGVTLSEEFQLDPEQSTSAIIVPHPEAKYFVA